MDAVRVGGAARWVMITLAVTGSVLLMAGILVWVTTFSVRLPLHADPSGAAHLAAALVAGGMACGLSLVAAVLPRGRRGRGARRQPAPDSADEWLAAMRPQGGESGPRSGQVSQSRTRDA